MPASKSYQQMGGQGSSLESHLAMIQSPLLSCVKQKLTEDQIFRIVYYLDKELVGILLVIHFSILVLNLYGQGMHCFAMETHVSLYAKDIRNEKVRVLRSIKAMQLRMSSLVCITTTTKGKKKKKTPKTLT